MGEIQTQPFQLSFNTSLIARKGGQEYFDCRLRIEKGDSGSEGRRLGKLECILDCPSDERPDNRSAFM